MKQKILNVALLGMSEKNVSTFAYFIRKQANELLKLSTASIADVFIVDFDNPAGVKLWQEHCAKTASPAIVLAMENPNKAKTIWVKKPVVSNDLQKALLRLINLYNSPASEVEAETQLAPTAKVEQLVAEKPPIKAVETPASKTNKGKAGYQRSFSDEFSPNLTLSKDEIAECCGIRNDMQPSDKDFDKQVMFTEDKTLLHSLKQAIKLAKDKQMVVYIEGLPLAFAVLPEGDKVFVDLNNRHLRHLCVMPMQVMPQLKAVRVNPLDYNSTFSVPVKHMPSTEQVLWQMALWAARGRLIKPLTATGKMRLRYWPNFTRWQITPYALQIAALWTRYDLSPMDVAQTLKIPQRYVFAVASAAQTVDNVEFKAESQDAIKVDWKPKNSLFANILRSLKIA